MGAVCSNAKTPRGSFAAPGDAKHTAATSEVIVTRAARPSSSKHPSDKHSSAPAAPDASPSRSPIAPPRAAALTPNATSQTTPVTSPTPAMRASNGGAGTAGGANAKKKRVAIAVEKLGEFLIELPGHLTRLLELLRRRLASHAIAGSCLVAAIAQAVHLAVIH